MIASSVLTLALAAFAGLAQAQPLGVRANTISCSDDSTVGYLRYHTASFHQSEDAVKIITSAHGQQQLALDGNDGTPIKIRGRKCSSSALGLTYDINDSIDHNQPAKLYLFDDESKCLQRHAALHTSGPRKTHMTVEDCSSADDKDQARQFWIMSGNFSEMGPYYNGPSKDYSTGAFKTGDDYPIFASLDYQNNNIWKLYPTPSLK